MRTELLTATPLIAICTLLGACAECATSADCDFGEVCVSGQCEPQSANSGPGGSGRLDTTDGPQNGDDGTDVVSLPEAIAADYAVSPYVPRERGCLDDAFLPTNPALFVYKEEILLFFTEPSSTTAGGLDLWMTRSATHTLSFGPKELVAFDAGPMDFSEDGNETFLIAAQDATSAALFKGDDRGRNWSFEASAASQNETVGLCLDKVTPRFVRPVSSPASALLGFEDVSGDAVCRYRTLFWNFTSKEPEAVAQGRPAGAVFFDDRLFAASTSNLTFATSETGPFEALTFDAELGKERFLHRLTSDDRRLYILESPSHGTGRRVSLLSATGFNDWDTHIYFPDRPEDENKALSQADIAVRDGSIAVTWLLEDSVALLTVSTDEGVTWSAPASFIVPVEGALPRNVSLATNGATVYGAFQVGGPPAVEDTRICFTAFDPPVDEE